MSSQPAVRVADVVAALERRYPPELAADWDAVGLVVGAPSAKAEHVYFTVDVTESTVADAVSLGADVIVAHHPLLFRPVTSIAQTTDRGRLIATLIGQGLALFTAHTNADHARPGVSDALAKALGLGDTVPIEPVPAGQDQTGTGRVGRLATPMTVAEVAALAGATLGRTVRVAGDPQQLVRTLAVCGGAGDSLLAAVKESGADAYLTADLRHHVVLDFLADGGCPVIDAGHYATEAPWLAQAATLLQADLHGAVKVTVSSVVTDPWTLNP